MAWSDYWTPIRYGVAAVAGLTIAAVSYLALVSDEYVSVDAYAECLLGTVERCQATATGVSIETNTVTNVVFDYVADPSGRMWTPTGGTPTNYLVPVYVTNVDAVVSTNWTYAAEPPAVVTVERVTVGRVASVVTNGAAIYTNDSPAVLTNTFTNAVTEYIPAGSLLALWNATRNAITSYVNTNAGVDAWTVTGMFAACGFPGGWDTNSGPDYIAKTNMVQLYTVLSRLRDLSLSVPAQWRLTSRKKAIYVQGGSAWPDPFIGQSFDDAKQKVEDAWPAAVTDASEDTVGGPFRVYTTLIQPFASQYNAATRHESMRPVVRFHPHYGRWHPLFQWPTNTTMTFQYIATRNYISSDEDSSFDAQGCGVVEGTNQATLSIVQAYHNDGEDRDYLILEPLVRLPNATFDLTWPSDPSPQGHRSTRGFVIGDAFSDGVSFVTPFVAHIGFLYCTNAP